MILKEVLGLADLFKAQIFGIYKAQKVAVVCKNKKLVLTIFLTIKHGFKNFKNS